MEGESEVRKRHAHVAKAHIYPWDYVGTQGMQDMGRHLVSSLVPSTCSCPFALSSSSILGRTAHNSTVRTGKRDCSGRRGPSGNSRDGR